jgi:prolyl 4-hydroxylase
MKIEDIKELAILSEGDCLDLIRKTRPSLKPATVKGSEGNELRLNVRTAEHYKWRKDCRVSRFLRKYLALAIDQPLEHIEPVEVIKYEKGGFFVPHVDGRGRTHSMMVWLNLDFSGGKTIFHALPNHDVQPEKVGNGILWENNPATIHSGDIVTKGEKWVATVWARDKPIDLEDI